jgi:hypothetical protein
MLQGCADAGIAMKVSDRLRLRRYVERLSCDSTPKQISLGRLQGRLAQGRIQPPGSMGPDAIERISG